MANFVVLSNQRAGSHFVMNMLNSHPDVHCKSDFQTSDAHIWGPARTFELGFTPVGRESAVGFLLKIKQKLYGDLPPGTKVVFLKRKNLLAQFLSRKLSDRFGCYEAEGGTVSDAERSRFNAEPIELDFGEACEFFKRTSETEAAAVATLTDPLRLEYEALVADRSAEMSKVWDFLEVAGCIPKTTVGRGSVKLDKRPIHVSISNYDDLVKRLRKSVWAAVVRESDGS